MEVEIAALCDAATEQGGKLNILGAFDTLVSPQFPFTHPLCAFVCRLRFSRVEDGEHSLRVNFVNNDGIAVLPPLEAVLKIACPPHQESVISNIILHIQGMKVEKPGKYSIDLAVDNRHELSLPLRVIEIKEHGEQSEESGAE